jgi:alginate O-acetyltransferase complex protein AlgI
MLFSSNAFIFLFLPIALLGFQIVSRFGRVPLFSWLALASLFFYGYWNPAYILLLIASVFINYIFSILIARAGESAKSRILVVAIIANLGLLIWFKYLFPVLHYFHSIGWSSHSFAGVILPLGISFFTFTQIAYLVDLAQEVTPRQDLLSYILFVTFFPHLIAGPIIHHSEMMPQFAANRRVGIQSDDFSVGITWFLLGLGKKVLLADRFGPMADALYAHPNNFGLAGTWVGMLCYAFQLYFDFSGYSDMALGLARMFSISFPVNFNSPYKAENIIDFWQRWHMTLSRYLGVYLYNPIAMAVSRNRIKNGKKVNRRAAKSVEGFTTMLAFPLLSTMFLAGMWHGAGMQFIIFGVLHGIYLAINHGFRTFVPEESRLQKFVPPVVGVLLTFGAVLVGQVFFRADSVKDALYVLGTLVGLHGRGPALRDIPVAAANMPVYSRFLLHPAGAVVVLTACFFVVWGLPNTQEILNQLEKGATRHSSLLPRLYWRPNVVWTAGLCFLLVASLMLISESTSFLYFQF